MTLGEKLRTVRLQRGMTLHDVAEKTGYSKALISRIENDSVSPSITSLIKVTEALEFSLHELFVVVEGNRAWVVRKNERESPAGSSKKVRIEYLCQSGADTKMAAIIKTFDAGSVHENRDEREGAEQWWHLLKGKLEVTISGEKFELNEGDSIYLSSSQPHKWRNTAKGKSSALIVMRPPAS